MQDPWYADGLRFTCTRCGHCCTGQPGVVWVTDQEVADIAAFRGEKPAETEAMHTRLVNRRRSLRERPNGDCVFWDRERGCTVYSVRPRQCQTWPFWDSHLATPERWEEVRETCPGAGKGELISEEEITRRLQVIQM